MSYLGNLGSLHEIQALRMFARKSSNIDFFIKLLLQLGYELLLTEMQKNWGVTDFVSEIRYLKGHPNIEKMGLPYAMWLQCLYV